MKEQENDANFSNGNQWTRKREELMRITEEEGWLIEQGIVDVVIGLNLLGIETDQSCEGHLNRPVFMKPNVRFEEKDDPKVQALIDEFYKNRKVSKSAKLQISHEVHRGLAEGQGKTLSRVESKGTISHLKLLFTNIEKLLKQEMTDYQTEMEAFADFLRQKYEQTRDKE